MRVVATALLMSAAAAWGSAAEAGRDGQSVRKETAAVELRIREMAAEKWTRASFGRREQDLCMEPLPRREGDPAGLRRYLLTAEGQPPCLLLVVVDEQTGEPQSMQLQDTAATTEELVRNKYASVLRDAQTGRTLALRGSVTQEQLRAWGTGDFVPHVGTGGGALTPTGPLFGPVWFLPVGVSKAYASPMTTLPAAAPSAPANPPLLLLGAARPEDDEQQPAEEEESQEVASVAVAASSSSAAAGGSFGTSGGGAGSGRSAARMSLRLLGSTASGAEESPAEAGGAAASSGDWEYGWDFEKKCAVYRTSADGEWKNLNDLPFAVNNEHADDAAGTDWKGQDFGTITENTIFNTSVNPASITAEGEHINVVLKGTEPQEHFNPPASAISGVDTIQIGTITYTAEDGTPMENGFRLRFNDSDLINSYKAIYCEGGQLWFYNREKNSVALEVNTTLYIGGTKYDDMAAQYANKGLHADIRAEAGVHFNNEIHLIDSARIISLMNNVSSGLNEVIFTGDSVIHGHGFDFEFGAADPSVRAAITYQVQGTVSDVRGLIIGGAHREGSTYGSVTVDFSGKMDVGSLSVGHGSVLNVQEPAGFLRFHNIGPGSEGKYHYSMLLENSGDSVAAVNFGDKAVISCAGDKLTAAQTSGLPVGVISGELAMQVQGDKVTLSGGKTAAATQAGSKEASPQDASGERSTLLNLAVDLKAGASLELNDMVLSSYHALRGTDANEVRLNNVVVDLTAEYTMAAQDPAQKPSVLYSTGNAPGEGKTLSVADSDKVIVLDYTGMSNLHFTEGGTLVLDFEGLNLSGYNYVAVDFGDSVNINPEMVAITGNTGHSDPNAYYIKVEFNTVYFHLAPEPASAALCLLGLAAGAVRRRRKPLGRA